MNSNHTDITIVLDRSGSMSSVAADTIGGFNRFLADQRTAPGTASVTLHQFDTVFDTVVKAQDVQTAPDLTVETFRPRGYTALLDAIGTAINDTGARLAAASEQARAGKVIFVIITDGIENASREYTQAKVFEMIAHQREKYHWQFVFLGANQDAIAVASNMGITPANAMTYAHNPVGTQSAFRSLASNTVKMRCGSKMNMSFEPEDRDAQAKAGV